MVDLVPSYLLKLDRAKKHLGDLKIEVDNYRKGNPYEVRRGVKKEHNLYWVEITEQPNDRIRLIAADLFHNVHSGLDHIACALVPSKNRSSVSFPVFWQGVWEPIRYCESLHRINDRIRWKTITRDMSAGAVTVLQTLQPVEDPWHKSSDVQVVEFIHRLWNRDKHMNLPVLSVGLVSEGISWELNGVAANDGGQSARHWLDDRTPFIAVEGTVNVVFHGSVNVGIRPGEVQRASVPVVEFCEHVLDFVDQAIYQPLNPFVRKLPPPKKRPRQRPWGPGAPRAT